MHGPLSLVGEQKDTEQITGFKHVSQGKNSADIILIFPNKLGLGAEALLCRGHKHISGALF